MALTCGYGEPADRVVRLAAVERGPVRLDAVGIVAVLRQQPGRRAQHPVGGGGQFRDGWVEVVMTGPGAGWCCGVPSVSPWSRRPSAAGAVPGQP